MAFDFLLEDEKKKLRQEGNQAAPTTEVKVKNVAPGQEVPPVEFEPERPRVAFVRPEVQEQQKERDFQKLSQEAGLRERQATNLKNEFIKKYPRFVGEGERGLPARDFSVLLIERVSKELQEARRAPADIPRVGPKAPTEEQAPSFAAIETMEEALRLAHDIRFLSKEADVFGTQAKEVFPQRIERQVLEEPINLLRAEEDRKRELEAKIRDVQNDLSTSPFAGTPGYGAVFEEAVRPFRNELVKVGQRIERLRGQAARSSEILLDTFKDLNLSMREVAETTKDYEERLTRNNGKMDDEVRNVQLALVQTLALSGPPGLALLGDMAAALRLAKSARDKRPAPGREGEPPPPADPKAESAQQTEANLKRVLSDPDMMRKDSIWLFAFIMLAAGIEAAAMIFAKASGGGHVARNVERVFAELRRMRAEEERGATERARIEAAARVQARREGIAEERLGLERERVQLLKRKAAIQEAQISQKAVDNLIADASKSEQKELRDWAGILTQIRSEYNTVGREIDFRIQLIDSGRIPKEAVQAESAEIQKLIDRRSSLFNQIQKVGVRVDALRKREVKRGGGVIEEEEEEEKREEEGE